MEVTLDVVMVGDLECDLGVTRIDELVCNFGGERCSSGFGFRILFTRHVLQKM